MENNLSSNIKDREEPCVYESIILKGILKIWDEDVGGILVN